MKNRNPLYLFLPLIIGISIAMGIYIGYYYTENALNTAADEKKSINKIDLLLDIIHREYVDSLKQEEIIEKSIPHIMTELDPHSKYIPAKDLNYVNNALESTFGGIGVRYFICDDTIVVTEVVAGGPSEQAGIQKFDRIIQINDTLFVGKDITRSLAINKLRGKKGTQVKIGVKRNDVEELLQIPVIRGDIPQSSIDVSYKTGDDIGYIKISKFAVNTYQEFLLAIAKLKSIGCKSFIIDLRENPGGILDAAVNMANEFLPMGRLIVYAEGKSYPRIESYSNGSGSCQDVPLVLLLNENSASSSEVFAGAIQDNDRGLVIGLRSFGKGLVQKQPSFSDGSALRLTVARFYTPSGRSIQKPYKPGSEKEYEDEVWERFYNGELTNQDSIKYNKNLLYRTMSGRPVYGGGGITPDIFVPIDTSYINAYYLNVSHKMLIETFGFRYAEANKDTLSTFGHYWPLYQYLSQQDLLSKFVDYAEDKGVRRRPNAIDVAGANIEIRIEAQIAQIILGDEGFFPTAYLADKTYRRALRELKEKTNPIIQMNPVLFKIEQDSITLATEIAAKGMVINDSIATNNTQDSVIQKKDSIITPSDSSLNNLSVDSIIIQSTDTTTSISKDTTENNE